MALDQVQNFNMGSVTATTATTVSYSNTGSVPFPVTGNPYNIVIWNTTVAALPQLDPNVAIFRVTSATSSTFTGSWVDPSNEYASASTLSLTSGDVYTCILSLTAKMIEDLNTLLFGNLVSSNLSGNAGILGSQLASPLTLDQNITLGGTLTNGTFNTPTLSSPTITGTATLATADVTTLDVTGTATLNNPTFTGTPHGNPYDIASGVSGPIGASQYVLFFNAVRAINIPANFSGSIAKVLTSFTNAATFTIYHNGTSIGSFSFAASGTVATFATSSAFTLAVGDELTVQAPSTADATAANLGITIYEDLS